MKPNPFNALDSTLASEMIQTPNIYKIKAINYRKKHANKNIEDLIET